MYRSTLANPINSTSEITKYLEKNAKKKKKINLLQEEKMYIYAYMYYHIYVSTYFFVYV